jgi:replication fork clamp-binding protein CrfC
VRQKNKHTHANELGLESCGTEPSAALVGFSKGTKLKAKEREKESRVKEKEKEGQRGRREKKGRERFRPIFGESLCSRHAKPPVEGKEPPPARTQRYFFWFEPPLLLSRERQRPMDSLIPVINKLHDAFAVVEGNMPIDLPQIVVVGSQSSGKSSVLENIVGRDFLPRGSGIVTRRPLILQLVHRERPAGKSAPSSGLEDPEDEWGEFLHQAGRKYSNFHEIRDEIARETDRVTGENKGISSVPINLKIYSPNVLNLTLVDLPGITKVPVGDQPPDIEARIREMIMMFVERANTIILAVTSANTDLANSDSLQLARAVDPEGTRTLGVITKLDLMDRGTDALDMLMGRVIPLQLGFVGVVNRSQLDIDQKKPIGESLRAERDFFNTHPIYGRISQRCGTQFLSTTLNKLLMGHIHNTLPELKVKLAAMIQDYENELKSYGAEDEGLNKGALLLQMMSQFSSNFTRMIDGTLDEKVDGNAAPHNRLLDRSELYGGARINYIYTEIFAKHLENLQPLDGLSRVDIRTAIGNATGPRAALFVPMQAFEQLVRRQLERLWEPALQCVDLVYDELVKIVGILGSDLQRYTRLQEAVVEASTRLLQRCRAPAKDSIENFNRMQANFINTSHPDFDVDAVIAGVMQRRAQREAEAQAQQQSQQQQQMMQQSQGRANQPGSRAAQPEGASGASGASSAQRAGMFDRWFGDNKQGESGRGRNDAAGDAVTLSQPPERLRVEDIPKQGEFEIELLEALLDAYFTIVRKSIQDTIPKAVMLLMVDSVKTALHNELIQEIYRESNFDTLLGENPDIVMKREQCKSMLKLLRGAKDILLEVREVSALPVGTRRVTPAARGSSSSSRAEKESRRGTSSLSGQGASYRSSSGSSGASAARGSRESRSSRSAASSRGEQPGRR